MALWEAQPNLTIAQSWVKIGVECASHDKTFEIGDEGILYNIILILNGTYRTFYGSTKSGLTESPRSFVKWNMDSICLKPNVSILYSLFQT